MKTSTERRKWKYILIGLLIVAFVCGIVFWINVSNTIIFSPNDISNQPCLVFLEVPSVHIPQPITSSIPKLIGTNTLPQIGILNKEILTYLHQLNVLDARYRETFNDTQNVTLVPITCEGKTEYLTIKGRDNDTIRISLHNDKGVVLDSVEQHGSYKGSHIVSIQNPELVWFQFYSK